MASRRLTITATSNDILADQDIRTIEDVSLVNLWATSVTLGDLIGLRLDKTIIMDDGGCNISAAALGMCSTERDQLVFQTVMGAGTLRAPVPTLTTSLIMLLSVEPVL